MIFVSSAQSFQYERRYQISNGPFSSVFCIKQRGKRYHTHYAAKYLRANTERAKREVSAEVRSKIKSSPPLSLTEIIISVKMAGREDNNNKERIQSVQTFSPSPLATLSDIKQVLDLRIISFRSNHKEWNKQSLLCI